MVGEHRRAKRWLALAGLALEMLLTAAWGTEAPSTRPTKGKLTLSRIQGHYRPGDILKVRVALADADDHPLNEEPLKLTVRSEESGAHFDYTGTPAGGTNFVVFSHCFETGRPQGKYRLEATALNGGACGATSCRCD